MSEVKAPERINAMRELTLGYLDIMRSLNIDLQEQTYGIAAE